MLSREFIAVSASRLHELFGSVLDVIITLQHPDATIEMPSTPAAVSQEAMQWASGYTAEG
jgi:hypothetical protein